MKYPEAEASFRRAIDLKSDCVEAHTNLAIFLGNQGRFDEAEASWRQAVRLRPSDSAMYASLGKILLRQSRIEEAMASYQEAIRLAPKSPDVLASWAAAPIELGKAENAIVHLHEALRINPSHVRSHAALSLLAREGRYHLSAEEMELLRRLLTDEKLARAERVSLHFPGSVLDKRGDYDEAFLHFQRGNDLKQEDFRQRGIAFDIEVHRQFIGDLIAGYTPEFFRRMAASGHS